MCDFVFSSGEGRGWGGGSESGGGGEKGDGGEGRWGMRLFMAA